MDDEEATVQTARRQNLTEWLRFLRADAHLLGLRPALLYQQAANQPDGASPATLAKARREGGAAIRPWLRWLNKPRHSDPCVSTLAGHGSMVWACSYSPDDRRILSGCADGTLKIWDAGRGTEIATLAEHVKSDINGSIEACAFSRDGRFIISASNDRTLNVWDSGTLELITTLRGHRNFVKAVSCSGRLVVSGSWDRTLKLWEIGTWREVATLEGHDGEIEACCFSPDGRWIISEAWDDKIKAWDVHQLQCASTMRGRGEVVRRSGFSPDGRRVVSIAGKTRLVVWDFKTGEDLVEIRTAHTDYIKWCGYSPDGERIATGSKDGTVRIWDAKTGRPAGTLEGHKSEVLGCAWSHSGRHLVSCSRDATLKVWDTSALHSATLKPAHGSGVRTCAYSPEGRRIVTGSWDGTLRVWDSDDGTSPLSFADNSLPVSSCAYTPDGHWIVSGSGFLGRGSLAVWDAGSGERSASLAEGETNAFAIAPGGEIIISGSETGGLAISEPATGSRLGTFAGHSKGILACTFSPDGRQFASSSWDGTVIVWDGGSWKDNAGRIMARIPIHAEGFRSGVASPAGPGVADPSSYTPEQWRALLDFGIAALRMNARPAPKPIYSPDGTRIIVPLSANTLAVWDAERGQPVRALTGAGEMMLVYGFSPDGRRVVAGTAGGRLWIWDIKSGTKVHNLSGHTEFVREVGYLADGRWLISGSADRTVRLWDAASGSEVAAFPSAAGITALRPGPGGRRIAAGDDLGQLHLLETAAIRHGRPIVTSGYLYRLRESLWDREPSVVCGECGTRHAPSSAVLDAIRSIAREAKLGPGDSPSEGLPDEAWEEQGLLAECPKCLSPLRFNPFLVDRRDRY